MEATSVVEPSPRSDYTKLESIPNVLDYFDHFNGYILNSNGPSDGKYALIQDELIAHDPRLASDKGIDHMAILACLCSAMSFVNASLLSHKAKLDGYQISLSRIEQHLGMR